MWQTLEGLVLRYPWLPVWLGAACLLGAICSTGCATHVVRMRSFDVEGRVVAEAVNTDFRLLSRGSTTFGLGPQAMLSVPALPPLQRPDKTDESVASQFEKLVARMEEEGRLRASQPKPTTTATGDFVYHTEDLEMSEDTGKMVRTGIIAIMTVWLGSLGIGTL